MAENFRINITLESIEFNFMFADYGGIVVKLSLTEVDIK